MPYILHLGLGNFHRAHQALYTHRANQAGGPQWRIIGVAMRNPAVRDAMAESNWAYDLGIMGPDGIKVERVSVHSGVLVAAETPDRVIAAIAAPSTRAITITVTEKGYGLRQDGTLDTDHPTISADIKDGTTNSSIALLAYGLERRHLDGSGPITLLSCDNLSGNGTLLRAALAAFLTARGRSDDVLTGVICPNTMVDRITPATSNDIAARITTAAGRECIAPVLTEAFSEWVIEDPGHLDLPDWAGVDVSFVPDAGPYEQRKLLLLNGAHSALAYGGLLKGHEFVHQAIADPELAQHVHAYWVEAAQLLPEFTTAEIEAYKEALLARYSTAGMAHRLSQIGMDGSLKLPQRMSPVLRHHGFQAHAAARVLADWWRVLNHRAETGAAFDDPLEPTIKDILGTAQSAELGFTQLLHAIGLAPGELPEGFAASCLEQ